MRTHALVGCALLVAAAGWAFVVAGRTGTAAGPLLALIGATAATYAVARVVGGYTSWLAPSVTAVTIGAVIAANNGRIRTGPLGDPLGYANANASLYALGALASLTAATTLPRRVTRLLAAGAAAALVVVTGATGSRAALGLVIVTATVVIALVPSMTGRVAVVGCAAVVAVALIGTIALGVRGPATATERPSAAGQQVSERRVRLWSEALDMAGDHLTFGAGFGSFDELSPTARADADARWAHHEYLELAAETGVVGAALLLALVGWTFVGLGRPGGGWAAAFGAAALATVAAHAAVDYVLHFAAVPIAAAALVGSASARPGCGAVPPG